MTLEAGMFERTSINAIAAALVVLGAIPASAQPGRFVNAKVTTRAGGSFEADFRAVVASASSPTWVGWSVPAGEAGRNSCCYSDNGVSRQCGCHLEGDRRSSGGSVASQDAGDKTIHLEGSDRVAILARVEDRAVQKIASYSLDCELDAGGLGVVWFDLVQPPASIAVLSAFAAESGTREQNRRSDGAVTAIAMHGDARADGVLVSFARAGQPDRIRERAIFWLGAARGKVGHDALIPIVTSDPSDRIRERAVFALSLSKAGDAIAELIDIAHRNSSAPTRGQAVFWLAQKAGQKVADTIVGVIENDPDTEVKKRAVFGLSQLPKDEGVPRLIEVARTNRNPQVRKQAIFWLGQSKDSRALAYIEQVLTK